jgi:hypothetical protein
MIGSAEVATGEDLFLQLSSLVLQISRKDTIGNVVVVMGKDMLGLNFKGASISPNLVTTGSVKAVMGSIMWLEMSCLANS